MRLPGRAAHPKKAPLSLTPWTKNAAILILILISACAILCCP